MTKYNKGEEDEENNYCTQCDCLFITYLTRFMRASWCQIKESGIGAKKSIQKGNLQGHVYTNSMNHIILFVNKYHAKH